METLTNIIFSKKKKNVTISVARDKYLFSFYFFQKKEKKTRIFVDKKALHAARKPWVGNCNLLISALFVEHERESWLLRRRSGEKLLSSFPLHPHHLLPHSLPFQFGTQSLLTLLIFAFQFKITSSDSLQFPQAAGFAFIFKFLSSLSYFFPIFAHLFQRN